MFILITGGCKNGRSAIGEKIICSYNSERFYIATMQPFGKEAKKAIERHRIMRSGKEFTTIEQYTNIENAKISDGSAILLECIGNLCANEIFSANCKNAAQKITCGIEKLLKKSDILVAVTNQVSCDGIVYPTETMYYIEELSRLNKRLAELADTVIEAVFGIPVLLKGEFPLCLC